MLSGYRQARWRAVILYGLAGIGKTAIAQALADSERIKRTFRDGSVWLDGSRDPEEEVMRLCLALGLERTPGERWVTCWRRWAGASERRLLLIVDDAVSAEGLPPFIAGLGPQVVALITTQQGAEISAEVERWLPADTVMEAGVHGLVPVEGRQLVEAVVGRPLTDVDWANGQEIGELVGWHPEALRLAAVEGREVGWQGALGELRAGRMPWSEIRRLVMQQRARLDTDQQAWLVALLRGTVPGAGFTTDEAGRRWQVHVAVAVRRLWILKRCGLIAEAAGTDPVHSQWRIAQIVHQVSLQDRQ